MAHREIEKNTRERVRVRASHYEGHDLVDIRIFAPVKDSKDPVPTRRGISLNIDLVPDLIDALLWALAQPSSADEDAPARAEPSGPDAERLANLAHAALRAHGAAVHWDSAEKMVLARTDSGDATKWDLHYLLARRGDLFEHLGGGVFRAR